MDIEHSFDEYVLLSNGLAGSTTAIFADQVMSLARNSGINQVKPSLVAVTYGGLEDPSVKDMTMADHAASLNNPPYTRINIASVAMYMMMESFIKSDDDLYSTLSTTRTLLEDSLPEVPYFYDIDLVPILNYYDNFMQPGALPEQYIHVTPDKNIHQLYTYVIFELSSDLEELYSEASRFFSNGAGVNSTDGGEHANDSSVVGKDSLATGDNEEDQDGSSGSTLRNLISHWILAVVMMIVQVF